jgi:hypothetical protein
LQQEDGPLRGAAPNQLAAFSLAILHINVSARIFQAAILELTIYEDAVVEDNVLVFKRLVLNSVHDWTPCSCAIAPDLRFAPVKKYHYLNEPATLGPTRPSDG